MPSTSRAQQQAAGVALAAKRGEISKSELKGPALQMDNDMTEDQLKDFAETKHTGKPEHVPESTTSRNLDYEKHSAKDLPAPKTRKQGVTNPIDEPDPEFSDKHVKPRRETVDPYVVSGGDKKKKEMEDVDGKKKVGSAITRMDSQVRSEGDPEIAKKQAQDLLYDEKDQECDIEEARYTFKEKQPIKYDKKSWTVKASTRDWVELEDNRGFTQIVDYERIKSFKNGSIITERDVDTLAIELERMNRVKD